MKINKLFLFLLLLFTTYSCQVEEIGQQPREINSIETSLKINSAFLTHKLSDKKMKPIWKSAITFENIDAVEVNFTIDKKYYKPLSKNGEIAGRQRLLLTLEKGVIKETIIEYRPSNNFTGDIKDINSGNFKKQHFEGEIALKSPKSDYSIVWIVNREIIEKKLIETKNKTIKKTSKSAGYESCQWNTVTYWLCVGSGVEESCFNTTEDLYQCEWIEDQPTNPDTPPTTDPYDCSLGNWPWCGGNDDPGSDGGGPNTTNIEDKINGTNLDPCSKDILDKLKNATVCDIKKIIERLDNHNSKYNLDMKSEIAPSGKPAQTIKNSVNNYTTYISTNYEDKTKLFIAASMLHETVHAYFMSLFDDYYNSSTPNPNAYNDFSYLFNYYVTLNRPTSIDPADIHHQQMATDYVDAIARALQEFQTGIVVPETSNPQQIYTDLAWGGLSETPVFLASFPNANDRQRILNRYEAEQRNLTIGEGSPNTQSPISQPCN
ncbi:hypothetical protein [Flavobacterium sp. SORGH_AS_0622]|uniref:hypothetical protein n=1 Tax=Flavobacterium sp. SORGH_AS_0622 TaxID=3041772 RepID=UPI00278ACE70|nr:hypothetical protein [Flavobacterium sp. SORGH_AS_0622]MDQ1164852.1 hypothetical protein [Flavobacterium sp. SORGH_AS_0622]